MKKKKIMTSLMSFALLTTMIANPLYVFANTSGNWSYEVASAYKSGNGSANDPYLIANASQLALLAKDANSAKEQGKYYKLDADIDLSGKAWTPIGTDADGFHQANLDGDNHVIRGMVVKQSGMAGFIGFHNASTVRNIGLLDVIVEGSDEVGGLIAYAKDSGILNSAIDNCFVSGEVKGIHKVGGLIGNVQYDISQSTTSPITNSFSVANVTGEDRVGGFAGLMQNVEDVKGSFASGNVVANNGIAGGFAGSLQAVNVNQAYASGKVSGKQAGGFAGSTSMGSVKNIYAVGEVSGTQSAGITGNNDSALATTYENVYFAKDTTKQDVGIANESNTAIKGLSEQDMIADAGKASMPFSDFDSNWMIVKNIEEKAYYPQLKVFLENNNQVMKDTVLKNTGTQAYYKVTFDIKDGKQLDDTPLTQYVKYLNVAQAPNVHKANHTLTWDHNLTITGDVVITAIFAPIKVTSLQVSGASLLYVGQKSKLEVSQLPDDAIAKEITWNVIEGEEVLRIDEKGNVEAIATGQAKVEVSLSDKSEIKAVHEIEVKDGTVEIIEKDIVSLPEKITYEQKEDVLAMMKAYRALSRDQQTMLSEESTIKLNNAILEISKLMKTKSVIQVSGKLDLGVEVYLTTMPKTRKAWVDFTKELDKHVYQVMRIELYDHFQEAYIQPEEAITIKVQTSKDYTKEKNVKVVVAKEDGSFVHLTPSAITDKTVSFETVVVGTMAIAVDEPEEVKEELKEETKEEVTKDEAVKDQLSEETKKDLGIVNTADDTELSFLIVNIVFALSVVSYLVWRRKKQGTKA